MLTPSGELHIILDDKGNVLTSFNDNWEDTLTIARGLQSRLYPLGVLIATTHTLVTSKNVQRVHRLEERK